MTNAIEIQQLSKQFKAKVALHPLTLSIPEGQLFGLLGVNGAGKTTLIKMLTGLLKPSAGNAQILGHSLSQADSAIHSIIAVSPQETAIAPNLTVRENLLLMARIHGFSKLQATAKVDEMIAQFSLQPFEKQRGKTLSGGWQRKLSIAMALILEPRILFLDEPTLGLDIISRHELWKMIKNLKNSTTIVLTTHYLEEAVELCDRICILKDGYMMAVGTVDELIDQSKQPNFERAFVHFVTGGEF